MKPGEPLYVPGDEVAAAMSLGASFVEGDARLRVPVPMPVGVSPANFDRWTTPRARLLWLGEFIESLFGQSVDFLNIAGILDAAGVDVKDEAMRDIVPLYVPTSEMDRARIIPGVSWNRRIRMYVADQSADLDLIFPYLTAPMKALWLVDRNAGSEVSALVKSRAFTHRVEFEGDPEIDPREISPDNHESCRDIEG